MSTETLIKISEKLLPTVDPKSADIILVELASKMMETRLTIQRNKGNKNWQKIICITSELKARLVIAVKEDRMVDAMNLAAMIQVKKEVLNQHT